MSDGREPHQPRCALAISPSPRFFIRCANFAAQTSHGGVAKIPLFEAIRRETLLRKRALYGIIISGICCASHLPFLRSLYVFQPYFKLPKLTAFEIMASLSMYDYS